MRDSSLCLGLSSNKIYHTAFFLIFWKKSFYRKPLGKLKLKISTPIVFDSVTPFEHDITEVLNLKITLKFLPGINFIWVWTSRWNSACFEIHAGCHVKPLRWIWPGDRDELRLDLVLPERNFTCYSICISNVKSSFTLIFYLSIKLLSDLDVFLFWFTCIVYPQILFMEVYAKACISCIVHFGGHCIKYHIFI